MVVESGGRHPPNLFPAIDVVSKEKVVAFRWKTAVLEQPKQVEVLTVSVTCKKKGACVVRSESRRWRALI